MPYTAKKKVCTYCGNDRFGLVRYYWNFSHFCTQLCKQRFLERRAKEFADYKSWLSRISHPPPAT